MDLFKMGMRKLFGIVLPGAILLLVLSYGLFTIASALGRPPHYGPWMADFQSLILIVLFLLSYLFGSLMRLNSAANLDEKSDRLLQKKYMRRKRRQLWKEYIQEKYRQLRHRSTHEKRSLRQVYEKQTEKALRQECQDQVEDAWKALQPEPSSMVVFWDLVEKVSEFNPFPYPIWQFWRLKLYRPREAYIFFWQYKVCMRQDHVIGGTTAAASSGRPFFNYCKTVLYHARKEAGDLLVAEAVPGGRSAVLRGDLLRVVHGSMDCVRFAGDADCFAGDAACAPSLSAGAIQTAGPQDLNFVLDSVAANYHVHDDKGDSQTIQDLADERSGHVTGRVLYLVHRHAPSCPECSPESPKDTGDLAAS